MKLVFLSEVASIGCASFKTPAALSGELTNF